jgi:DDE family transposase
MEEPLRPYIDAIVQVRQQDIEEGGGRRPQLREGVAEDRRISIEDPEMRHGRKSKSKRFNGFKEHVATDLDSELILACAVTPANRPEEEACPQLTVDLDRQDGHVGELAIDRAYINSQLVADVISAGGQIVAKPWAAINRPGLFTKRDFTINMHDYTIRCPSGQVEHFEPGEVVEFDPEVCGACSLRSQCTRSASGRGRTVHIAEDERLQHRLRKLQSTRPGRARLRERSGVEHRLAHIAARQGPKARYKGTRRNLFDLRRMAVIQNLETTHRRKLLGPKVS